MLTLPPRLPPPPRGLRTQFQRLLDGPRLGSFDDLVPILTTGLNIAMQERVNYLKRKAEEAAREAAERQAQMMAQAQAQQAAAAQANAAAYAQAAGQGGSSSLWGVLGTPAGAVGALGLLGAVLYAISRR